MLTRSPVLQGTLSIPFNLRGNISLMTIDEGCTNILFFIVRFHTVIYNFAEYVPMILLLMGFAELGQSPDWRIHFVGIALLAGRLLHGYCFIFTESNSPSRAGGMILTFIALIAGALSCLWSALT